MIIIRNVGLLSLVFCSNALFGAASSASGVFEICDQTHWLLDAVIKNEIDKVEQAENVNIATLFRKDDKFIALTPLTIAVGCDGREMVELLLRKGACVDGHPDYPTSSPLYLAIGFNEPEIALLLIAEGANVNQISIKGDRPLHLALTKKMTSVVQKLIEKGADVSQKDQNGTIPVLLTDDTTLKQLLTQKMQEKMSPE